MAVTSFQTMIWPTPTVGVTVMRAEKRICRWAGAEDKPNEKYRDVHIWYDADNQDKFTAYKLLICDVVDENLVAVPWAIIAAAAIARGARSGIKIPEKDVDQVRVISESTTARWVARRPGRNDLGRRPVSSAHVVHGLHTMQLKQRVDQAQGGAIWRGSVPWSRESQDGETPLRSCPLSRVNDPVAGFPACTRST